MSLYLAALFVALTPGVLLTLPKGGNKMTVAVVHGLVFAVVWYFTHRMAWRYSMQLSGFQDMNMEEEMNAEGFQNRNPARPSRNATTPTMNNATNNR